MFDPAQLTLGQASAALRDLTVVFFMISAAWKSRGLYERAIRFLDRIMTHMDVMEQGMKTLLTNHLSHMEEDLRAIAGRKPDLIEDETEK